MKTPPRVKLALAAAALSFAASAYAADVTVFVDGASGPWDIGANPSFNYGGAVNGVADFHLAPTAVGSGLPFVVGDSLSVQYLSGNALAGANGTVWGVGGNGFAGWELDTGAPGQYIPGTNYLEQLIGVYANSAGVIVGNPFLIGSGPTLTVIPVGATQLLLGFNDGWYNDNGNGITVKVSEIAAQVITAQSILTLGFSKPTLAVGGTVTVAAESTSGLAAIFSSMTPTICTVSGSTVAGVSAGTCSIAANQAGNSIYSAAQQVTQSINVISQSDCVFNWAERTYPQYFSPASTADATYATYTYRYYSGTGIYLTYSSADREIYVLGASFGNNLVDVGSLSVLLGTSGCQ